MTPTDIMIILAVLAGIVYSAWNKRSIDEQLRRLEQRQTMEKLEQAYQQSNATLQQVVTLLIAGLRLADPAIPGQTETRIADLLEDIATPGASASPVDDASDMPADPA